MNPRWLLHAKRWAQNPPSMKKVLFDVGIVVFCVALYGLEQLGLLPDWMAADRVRRIH